MIADFTMRAPRPPQAALSDSCITLFPNSIPVFPQSLNINASFAEYSNALGDASNAPSQK